MFLKTKTIQLILGVSLILSLLFSCGGAERAMQSRLEKVHIGMSYQDFRKTIKGTSVVYMDQQYACLKLQKTRVKYGYGPEYSTRFFYFNKGELFKIDEGEKAVDYRLKIDN